MSATILPTPTVFRLVRSIIPGRIIAVPYPGYVCPHCNHAWMRRMTRNPDNRQRRCSACRRTLPVDMPERTIYALRCARDARVWLPTKSAIRRGHTQCSGCHAVALLEAV